MDDHGGGGWPSVDEPPVFGCGCPSKGSVVVPCVVDVVCVCFVTGRVCPTLCTEPAVAAVVALAAVVGAWLWIAEGVVAECRWCTGRASAAGTRADVGAGIATITSWAARASFMGGAAPPW
jgi:hypothetical protein